MAYRFFRFVVLLLALAPLASEAARAQEVGDPSFHDACTSAAPDGGRVVCADIVALEQTLVYNRFGSFNPFGMIFALNRDVAPLAPVATAGEGGVVDLSGAATPVAPGCETTLGTETRVPGIELSAGAVRLRDCKRPRPLVLRANVGDTFVIHVTNLLAPAPPPGFSEDFCDSPGSTADHGREAVRAEVAEGDATMLRHGEVDCLAADADAGGAGEAAAHAPDWPATRVVNFVVQGLAPLPMPGDAQPHPACFGTGAVDPDSDFYCRYEIRQEGTYFFASLAAPAGGEGDGGSLVHGLFGAILAERPASSWYRSQVTETALDAVWEAEGDLPNRTRAGSPDYEGTDAAGVPILNMAMRLGGGSGPEALEIVHGDLNAIVYCDPAAPGAACAPEPPRPDDAAEATIEPAYTAFREFSVFFHDELKTFYTRNFRELAQFGQLAGVRDGFAINYGASGMGTLLLANRKGIGPADDCMECLYEEFFLTSWANGDPALLEWYPDDPSNVHHSYLNDPVVFRNFHAGPKETHVFHLHAHQWFAGNDPNRGSYLDSQTVAPQQSFTYNVYHGGHRGPDDLGTGWWDTQGSGNRNRTLGDSIFHCHLYPHFAQGMWALWRVHDVLEDGTRLLPDGQPSPGLSTGFTAFEDRVEARAGSIDRRTGRWLDEQEGTPVPALVPLPGEPLPLAPTYAEEADIGPDGELLADAATPMPGYPFYMAGQPGHRPPQAPLDIARNLGAPLADGAETDGRPAFDLAAPEATADAAFRFGEWLDGGLNRHVVSGRSEREFGIALPAEVTDPNAFAALDDLEQVLAMRQVIAKAFALGDLSAHLTRAEIDRLDPFGERLERGAMGFHYNGLTYPGEDPSGPGLRLRTIASADPVAFDAGGYPTGRAVPPGGDTDPPDPGEDAVFYVNGSAPRPGAPFADPCGVGPAGASGPDPLTGWLPQAMVPDPRLDGFRRYEASAVQLDLIVNRAGWHDPQARINVLTAGSDDYKAGSGLISPRISDDEEPFFFRAFSGECLEFRHTNELPHELELDDFQVRTPTDTIGQHIHLVKFDVTSSDGSGNGWNYEDGTFAPDEIATRLCAWAATEDDDAVAVVEDLAERVRAAMTPEEAQGFPAGTGFCGWSVVKDQDIWRLERSRFPFLFQTTTQRWFADPILSLDEDGEPVDRTMRTVFTHDHFGPSSIQQHGFYAALVIEPPADDAGATPVPTICHGESDAGIACAAPLDPNTRRTEVAWGDRRLVGTRKTVDTQSDNTVHPSYREFALSIADFALLYDPRDRTPVGELAAAVNDTTGRRAEALGGMEGMARLYCEARHRRAPFNLRDVCGVPVHRDGPGLSFFYGGDPPAWVAGGAFRDDIHRNLYQGDMLAPLNSGRSEIRALFDHLIEYRMAAAGLPMPEPGDLLATYEMASPVAGPERPESISVDHHDPYLVSYRGAPIPLRIADKDGGADRSEDCAPMAMGRQGRHGAADEESEVEAALADGTFPPCSFSHQLAGEAGDLGNALHSGLHWDPETPVLEAYEGERLVFRMVQGAQEVQHTFTIAGQPFRRHIDGMYPQGMRPLAETFVPSLQDLCHARPEVVANQPGDYRLWWREGLDAADDPANAGFDLGHWAAYEAALAECDNIEGFSFAQEIGISEHFEMQGSLRADVPASVEFALSEGEPVPPAATAGDRPTGSSDYLYHFGTVDALWNGAWGLVRIYEDNDTPDPATVAAYNAEPVGPETAIGARLGEPHYPGDEFIGGGQIVPPGGTGLACPLPDEGQVQRVVDAVVVAVETRRAFDGQPGTIYDEGVYDPDGALLVLLAPEDLGVGDIADDAAWGALTAESVIADLRAVHAGQPEPFALRVRAGDCLRLRVLNLLGEEDGTTRDLLGDAVLPPIVPLNADPLPHVDEATGRVELARLPDASAPAGVRPSAALGLTFGLPGLDLIRDTPLGFGYNRPSLEGGFGGVSVGPLMVAFAGRFTVGGEGELRTDLANRASAWLEDYVADNPGVLLSGLMPEGSAAPVLAVLDNDPPAGAPGLGQVFGERFGLRIVTPGVAPSRNYFGDPDDLGTIVASLCRDAECPAAATLGEDLAAVVQQALWHAADDITHWVPYAFGAVPVRTTGDVITQTTHGLMGAIVVEPVTWRPDEAAFDCDPAEGGYERCSIRPVAGGGDGQGRRYIVPDPDGGPDIRLREFVLFFQDGLNHWDEASRLDLSWADTGLPVLGPDGLRVRMVPDCPVCDDSYDRGEAAVSYHSSALARLLRDRLGDPGIEANSDLNAFAFPADWPLSDAGQPRLRACEGEQVVIRVVHPGGRARQQSFAVNGYSYDELFPGFGFPRSALLAPGKAIAAWLDPKGRTFGDEAQTIVWHDGPATLRSSGVWGLLDILPAASPDCAE